MVSRLVVKADVDAGTITVAGEELDRYAAMALMAEVSRALMAIAPPPERGWDQDPHREAAGGRVRRT